MPQRDTSMLAKLHSWLKSFGRRKHGRYELRWLAENPDFAKFSIGRCTYGVPTVLFAEQGQPLVIGSYCSIAPGVTILLGGNHRTDWVTSFPFAEFFPEAAGLPLQGWTKGGVTIGNDVWIGQNVLILSGVTIGNGAIIAAGSVVVKDVPPYALVAGNPASLVRMRVPEEYVADLERIAWWDWPEGKVKAAWPALLSGDTAHFVQTYGAVKNRATELQLTTH
jgi:acetyltransferase-like isoleucine patch superfamily enzyme